MSRGTIRATIAVASALAALTPSVQAAAGPADASAPRPELRAAAWYLVGDDGTLLAEQSAEERRAVASITKLMTAVVALEHARLPDVVTVGTRSARAGESTANLRTGERLSVALLLRALLVASANDAADALAGHVGRGSVDRFVALMNAKAAELGLTGTSFRNPHGLDQAGHLSNAEDATKLVRYAIGIPFIRDALERSSVELPGGRRFETTDDLLGSWAPLVGGKTGHTADAGWSQAAAARAKGVTVYGTVLGSASRSQRNDALESLLRFGLDRYRRVTLVDASRVYAESPTGYGREPVELVAPRTVLGTVHERRSLVERVVAPEAVELPVRRGQRLGRVEIYDGTRLLAKANLVAADSVSEPSALGKAAWYARRTAANVWELVS
jgi:D-alanyl-D-alanine carboxypeptidase (penicillin-binding protein 5/6)